MKLQDCNHVKATFVITLVFDGRFYVNREFICVKINLWALNFKQSEK